MDMYRKQKFEIQSNLCTTMVTLRKWQGDCYIQGDRYLQVNSAENIRQLKILRSCPVTVIHRVTTIYRAIIYRFDCSLWFYKGHDLVNFHPSLFLFPSSFWLDIYWVPFRLAMSFGKLLELKARG